MSKWFTTDQAIRLGLGRLVELDLIDGYTKDGEQWIVRYADPETRMSPEMAAGFIEGVLWANGPNIRARQENA